MAAPAEAKQESSDETRVVITGANRGIGLEFVKQLLQRDGYTIVACCRSPDKADALKKLQSENQGRVSIEKLESTSDADIEALFKSLGDSPIDILLLNAGILGTKDDSGAFRKMGTLQRDDFLNTLNVNVVGPMLLGQALFDNVAASTRKQIVGITSGMGSISDCGSNSLVPYRCSKTAMNMAFQAFAKESEAKKLGVHAVTVNPGWVQTDMGGKNASKTVTDSVQEMLDNVIDKYAELDNGGFYNYSGKVFGW